MDDDEVSTMIDLRHKITLLIADYVKGYKASYNTKSDWEEPIVAFADANDPLFLELQSTIGQGYLVPRDLLFSAKTVICFFVPFKKEIVISNMNGDSSSEEWAIAFLETNSMIDNLNKYIVKELEQLSFLVMTIPVTHNFDDKTLVSNWSHKHAAYVAGLGKFGLHHMLITSKGCCGRIASIVTNAKIEPNIRPENDFCLFFKDRNCTKCVEKCTYGALKETYFDKHVCYDVCLKNAALYQELGLCDVCGKCICAVPCSFSNPVKEINN